MWKDIAPDILRQRLIIEGIPSRNIFNSQIKEYLEGLTKALDMEKHSGPSLSHHAEYGLCAHLHWVTSGVHMYTWEENSKRPTPFFTVDIYTCKAFKEEDAVEYTKQYFEGEGNALQEIAWRKV